MTGSPSRLRSWELTSPNQTAPDRSVWCKVPPARMWACLVLYGHLLVDQNLVWSFNLLFLRDAQSLDVREERSHFRLLPKLSGTVRREETCFCKKSQICVNSWERCFGADGMSLEFHLTHKRIHTYAFTNVSTTWVSRHDLWQKVNDLISTY